MLCYSCLKMSRKEDMKPQTGKSARRGGRSLCCVHCGKTTMLSGG